MATLTFLGNEGSPDQVEWNGVVFPVGVAVPLDLGRQDNRHMLEKARGNPFFEVDEDAEGIGDVSEAEIVSETPAPVPAPETPTEDATETDYVPADQIAEMDKEALRAALKALGIQLGPNTGVATLRAKLQEAMET